MPSPGTGYRNPSGVLIWFYTRRFWGWRLAVTIFVIAVLACPNLTASIYHVVAKSQPVSDAELVAIIEFPNQIVSFGMPVWEWFGRFASQPEWHRGNAVGCEHSRDVVVEDLRAERSVKHVLRPRDIIGVLVPTVYRHCVRRSSLNIKGWSLSNIFWENITFESGAECVVGGFKQLWANRVKFNPRSFVGAKVLRGLLQSASGDLVLLNHGAPHKRCYYGVGGNCTESPPSSILYRFLSSVIALILGGRISYRLLVKGDDCLHLKRIKITWHLLIPFSFLCTAYGFGALMQCVLYFTQPCEDCQNTNNVPRKYLTQSDYCNTVMDMANVLPIDKQIAVIGALAEGSSIRSIERLTGIHRDTIMRLGVRIGRSCEILLDSKMQDLNCNYLQMDEVWGFIGKKQRHVGVDDNPELGDVWTYCAIDSETKLVPAFKCGKRNLATTTEFVYDVASRMRNRVQISTDALRGYAEAIEQSFGADVDYGQIPRQNGPTLGRMKLTTQAILSVT
jgi:IS1 family transposase